MELNLKSTISYLKEKLSQYQKVVLFVHELPDCDAIGSAYALKLMINLNFPHIDARIAGMNKDVLSKLPKFFKNQEQIVDSLFCLDAFGIICDTANSERVLSGLYSKCKESLRIDHHIKTECFATEEWVDDERSSTCEMVGMILRLGHFKISEMMLQSLYFGILTDTNRFLYDYTSTCTFDLMSWMMCNGFNREVVHNQIYLKSIQEAKSDNLLFNYINFHKEGYATLYLDNEDIKKNFEKTNLSGKVYLMANFLEAKIWLYIYYCEEMNIYKCSIRSREYPVNLIANKFNGGGHRLASGFKLTNLDDAELVEKEIKKMLKGNGY